MDIVILPFVRPAQTDRRDAHCYSRVVPIPKNCEKTLGLAQGGGISRHAFGRFHHFGMGTDAARRASFDQFDFQTREFIMLGKIAGAMLGKRLAGRNSGTKGALLGLGAAALARRSVPALFAVTAAGWGYNKWRERRARRNPTYPGTATPDY